MNAFVVAPLRLIHRSHVVGHFDRVLDHGPGLLQTLQRQVELPALAVNFRHTQVSLCVLGIGVRNDLVLLEGGIGLAVIHQVLGQAADCGQIVAIELNRLTVGIDGVLILLLLLVGVT